MKAIKKYWVSLLTLIVVLAPTQAFAAISGAESPEGGVMNVLQAVLTLLLILAPTVGGVALVFFGVQQYFAKESHQKAEIRGTMMNIVWTTVIIFVGVGGIKWIATLAQNG